MNRIAGRAWIAMLLVLALLAGFVFFLFEYITKADQWVIFPGSPHVYTGGNIGCGAVTDRDGILLLELEQERVYSSSMPIRKATVHWLGDRFGSINAPALSYYSGQIAGYDLLNGVYHYGKGQAQTSLTLSAAVQEVALEAMGSYSGTVAVYNYKTGELLCAVTTPTYDPDDLPEEAVEGMYLNRFTQSTYIPGSIYKIVTLAAAFETIPDIQEQTFYCEGKYTIGNDEVICDDVHWNQTLKEAFRNSCNCAFAQIAQQLGQEKLTHYVEQFKINESVTFDGITTSKGFYDIADASEFSVAWSAIGQHTDLINPCSFLTFVGAVANGGKGAIPYVVEQILSGGSKTYSAKTQMGQRILSAGTAQLLTEYMGFCVEDKYGSDNFPGMTVCAKTGTAEVGGEKKPNAMLAGFVADKEYPLAFIVCVEDAGYGKTVCIPIASKVLAACKVVLDE